MLCGWLSPHGSFFPCDPYEHIQHAEKIVYIFYQNALTKTRIITPDEILLHLHWIKMFRDGLHIHHTLAESFIRRTSHISDSQIQWIIKHQRMFSNRQERCLNLYLKY